MELMDDVEVKLIAGMGTDKTIAQAARVSILGENDPNEKPYADLLGYLLKNKHGSPFEHTAMTFYVKAPIFVFREFHRHRIGFSYNEMSARYTELPAEFYVPGDERPLVNVGTSARPVMGPADPAVHANSVAYIRDAYRIAWEYYQQLLNNGIAKEVARMVLPVGTMSQMYVTCNARSMMNFLSLRTHEPTATHVSRPQYEIELVARKMEAIFSYLYPVTYEHFNDNGRVAP